jgi:hypothetical protein
MTMQNLDVYETFRVRAVSCKYWREFNHLGISRREKQRLLEAGQTDGYSVDLVTKRPFLRGLDSPPRHVFLSRLGSLPCSSLLKGPLQERLVRRR